MRFCFSELEPWGEDETDMTRADQELKEMGWRRADDWHEAESEAWRCEVQPL